MPECVQTCTHRCVQAILGKPYSTVKKDSLYKGEPFKTKRNAVKRTPQHNRMAYISGASCIQERSRSNSQGQWALQKTEKSGGFGIALISTSVISNVENDAISIFSKVLVKFNLYSPSKFPSCQLLFSHSQKEILKIYSTGSSQTHHPL